MNQKIVFLILCFLPLFSCQRRVEIPLQIPYAEDAAESLADGRYALYLLSEVEDTIAFLPDSIQMRFRLAEAMGQNAQGELQDSLLPPLLEWFDANGPAQECARVHHLQALSLLRKGKTKNALDHLNRALEVQPSYTPSLFMSGYLYLYQKDYSNALERFMRMNSDIAHTGFIVQGAWAFRHNLGTGESDFVQALEGDELETVRRMLLDMEYAFTYFREHSDDEDKLDIIYRCAAIRDSMLHVQNANHTDQRLPVSEEKEFLQLLWLVPILLLFSLIILYFYWSKHSKSAKEQPAVFVEIVQRMEELADKGKEPTAQEWESLRLFIQERYPTFMNHLVHNELSRSELQMCLLSAVGLRQKQVATLLGISPQNLRNQRLRLLARVGDKSTDSVQEFFLWIEKLKTKEG